MTTQRGELTRFSLANMPWLTEWERIRTIDMLLRYELIEYDNARNLPLKKGGKTDIYINLRNGRNHPGALIEIAEIFANPLRRLCLERFGEIPDSVSCFAGLIAEATGLPYLTLRDKPKKGRVVKADMIGRINVGDRISLIDDVITDGASKIEPYRKCIASGGNIRPLVALVDRQQGWKELFEIEDIFMEVWPGMTLHDVRKHLIGNGLMQRCDPEVEAKNPIILALDGKSWDEVLPVIDELRTAGCILKVNDLMFREGIEKLIPNLEVYGRVMVDIKSHDIPNTIKNVGELLKARPPWAVTVHASGAEAMMHAMVARLRGTETKVLAVTVLTSIDEETCEEIYVRQPLDQVLKLAEIANRAGVHGFVCSPHEVPELKKLYPDKKYVTPGLQSKNMIPNDQKRVCTPAEAKALGSTEYVIGRQVFGARDPIAEVRLLKEELQVL